MTRYGTSYFVDKYAAEKYYREQRYSCPIQTVDRKLAEGEIHIGRPDLKPGQALYIIHAEGRYAIEEEGA